MLTKPQFDLVKAEVGVDRIFIFSRLPLYVEPEKLGTFLDELDLTGGKEKISYKNGLNY